MKPVFVIVGISEKPYTHLASLRVHDKISQKYKNNELIHFSFLYNDKLSIYTNIERQCSQMSCIFNDSNTLYVVCITCNALYTYIDYYKKCMSFSNVVVMNVIKIVCDYIINNQYRDIGIICTKLTKKSQIYNNCLSGNNINIDYTTINNKDIDSHYLYGLIRKYKDLSKDAVVIGCSELPIFMKKRKINGIKIIYPMELLIRNLKRFKV